MTAPQPTPSQESRDEITLPRSGLVLPLRKDCDASWVRVVPGIGALIVSGDAKADSWCAIFGNLSEIGTREECIAWLDARVLELRAALRERLAAAEALSESRRVTLLAKSDELVAEWKRAETDEALVRELAAVVKVAKAVSLRPTAALFRELEDLTLGLSPAALKEIEG